VRRLLLAAGAWHPYGTVINGCDGERFTVLQ